MSLAGGMIFVTKKQPGNQKRSELEPSSWRATPHWPGREQAEGCEAGGPVCLQCSSQHVSCRICGVHESHYHGNLILIEVKHTWN